VSEEQREYLGIIMENASKIRDVLDNALEQIPVSESHGEQKPLHSRMTD
jgi:hypothetical protein